MVRLVQAARVLRQLWQACAGCRVLFPAAPGEIRCRSCGGWS